MKTTSDSVAPSKLARLRRITSGGDFIPEIDGFRLLAILVVVGSHIYSQVAFASGLSWPRVLLLPGGGTRGVLLFFSISGFILGLPFARRALQPTAAVGQRPFSYRFYLIRRLTRLEPPYILSLLLRFVLMLSVLHVDMYGLAPHLMASLMYMHNAIFGSPSPVSPPTWSLEVEVQFYLLAPLLASVFRIRSTLHRRTFLLLVTLAFAILGQVFLSGNPRFNLSLAGNLQYFTAGFLLCDLYLLPPLPGLSTRAWDLLGIGALALLLWSDARWTIALFPFGALILYLAGLRGGLVRRFFSTPIVSIAGGMCYSIYLTHGTVLAAVAMIFAHSRICVLPYVAQFSLVLIISLFVVFLVATAFFILIERPCMDPHWPRRLRMMLHRRAQLAPF